MKLYTTKGVRDQSVSSSILKSSSDTSCFVCSWFSLWVGRTYIYKYRSAGPPRVSPLSSIFLSLLPFIFIYFLLISINAKVHHITAGEVQLVWIRWDLWTHHFPSPHPVRSRRNNSCSPSNQQLCRSRICTRMQSTSSLTRGIWDIRMLLKIYCISWIKRISV